MASLVNEEAKGHGKGGYTGSCPAKWNSKPGSPAWNPGHFTHLLLCFPESSSFVPHRSCERRQCYQFRLMQRLCPRSLGKEVELGFKFSLACFQGLCSSHYTKWFLLRSLSLSWFSQVSYGDFFTMKLMHLVTPVFGHLFSWWHQLWVGSSSGKISTVLLTKQMIAICFSI